MSYLFGSKEIDGVGVDHRVVFVVPARRRLLHTLWHRVITPGRLLAMMMLATIAGLLGWAERLDAAQGGAPAAMTLIASAHAESPACAPTDRVATSPSAASAAPLSLRLDEHLQQRSVR